MQKLEGYQNPDKIYESKQSLIYRAFEEKNNRSVILKGLNKQYPNSEEISEFNQEYELANRFRDEGVIHIYGKLNVNGSPMIIMEDIGGQSLAEILESKKLHSDEFLSLGIRIAEIIGNIHKRGIIHKDINPSNIIWNCEKDIVRIIDFGIATELPREITSIKNPTVLEGTLAYISPEQTGRMNRSLDYRTDFYSLGITFYRMLTGRLPFESKDLMKLVHSHIAKRPVSPHEIDDSVPLAISEIMMKLIAKNAEERYLSAYGLKADLERCLRDLRETGAIKPFELGLQDASDKFQIPQKLYGREEEIGTLMSAFERARKGDSELMLVSGFSGIGKSVLINEIHRPVVEHNGHFASGKFERLKKDVPYSAILQVFSGLASQILAEDKSEIVVWKEKILSTLGPNGKIITDLIPIFELILGRQPDLPTLKPTESQNRFNLVFQGFLKALASGEHPLVMFLDDLQWADLPSLHLLKLFATDPDIKYLFMIGAYRHNETPDSHPLILTLDEIRKAGRTVNKINLRPLSAEQVNLLLGDTLQRPARETTPLSEALIRKTRGNPFFINELLKSLYKEKLIEFSFEEGWSWHMTGIEEVCVTDNVVDLMAGKITDLPEDSQEVLKLGACIGTSFNLSTVLAVSGKPEKAVLSALNDVLREGMLNRIDNMFRFSHDRVLEAAYSLIPDDEKTRRHYRIGNLELHRTLKEDLPERLFYIVNQLNAGIAIVKEESEKRNLAELNLMAGKKALVSNAYMSALDYFILGIGLLKEKSWRDSYDFTLDLYQEAACASQLSADYEKMDVFSKEVFNNAKTILDKIKVYEATIFACQAKNQPLEGIRIGLDVLRRLGIWLPEKPGKLRVFYEFARVKMSLWGKSVETLINLPQMEDLQKLAVMRILTDIASSVYLAAPDLLPLLILNTVRVSIKYGNSVYSPYSYAGFGLIHCGVIGDIKTGIEWGKFAENYVEKCNIRATKSRVSWVVWYFINHWKTPLRDSLIPLLEAYKIGVETGDLEFAALSTACYSSFLLNSGVKLTKVESEMAKYAETIRKLNQDHVLYYQLIDHQTVLNLQGISENPCRIIGSSYDENKMMPVHKKANDFNAFFKVDFNLLTLNYHFENYKEALENIESIEQYIDTQVSKPEIPIINFYDSLVRLSLYQTENRSISKKYLRKAIQNQKKMKKWASHGPSNHKHKFYLVEAETARVRGQNLKAMDHYKTAAKLAHENNFLNEEALILKLTAKFWLGLDEEKIATLYMTEAYHTYRLWGANAVVKYLEKKYNHIIKSRSEGSYLPLVSPTSSIRNTGLSEVNDLATVRKVAKDIAQTANERIKDTIHTTSKKTSGISLDMSTVTKASQAISREIDLKKLLEEMISIIMENAGAEKGYVLLNRNDEFLIEAAADTNTNEVHILNSIKVEESKGLSKGIVNYVLTTGKSVVLPNEDDTNLFINDPYVREKHPKSVLCIPMRYMDKTTGVLYLENNITKNAFTNERIEILNILLSQAAISLENSFVYNHLDELVKERTAQLVAAQAELIENAHKAGMADIATGTLHNIGNILNSVKVSMEFIEKNYKIEFIENFKKANKLLRDNLDNIENFLVNDPKGRKLIRYYFLLEDSIEKDTNEVKSHIDRLSKKVDAIIDVVESQRSYAGAASLTENCHLSAIIEDALMMQQESLVENNIAIEKDFKDIQKVLIQKTKLIHILVNLITNAKEAMAEMPLDKRKLTFSVFIENNNAYIKVKDTGVGIQLENLRKIFYHGFTTKEDGQGFGLHSSANYMAEMKGRMWAESDGPGATFVLEFPITHGKPHP